MAAITVPAALAILQALSPNPDTINDFLPPRATSEVDGSKSIAELLDAIASFLPRRPESRQIYAITLSIGQEESCICVCADEETDLAGDDDPRKTIDAVWTFLKDIAGGDTYDRDESKINLIVFLLTLHWEKLKARFQKKARLCRLFFEYMDKALDSRVTDQARPHDYSVLLRTTKSIFTDTEVFLNKGEKERAPRFIPVCLKHNNNISKNQTKSSRWLAIQEESFERALGSEEYASHDLAGQRFSLMKYIDKLVSPYRHIATLLRIANIHSFKTHIAKLPLRIELVRPSSATSPPSISLPPEESIRFYLKNAFCCEVPNARDSAQVIDNAIEAIKKRYPAQVPLSAPHCECVLLRHHSVRKNITPFPFMGISKLSCFQCAWYFDAYDKYVRAHPGKGLLAFQATGCRNDSDVILCEFPGSLGDRAADKWVEDAMWASFQRVVGQILQQQTRALGLDAYDDHSDEWSCSFLPDIKEKNAFH